MKPSYIGPLPITEYFQELSALLDEGVYDMERFLEGGWVTGLKYEDEVLADLKKRVGCKEEEVRRSTTRPNDLLTHDSIALLRSVHSLSAR